MKIAIPSMGRADTQTTINSISPAWLSKTTLWVPAKEVKEYEYRSPSVYVRSVPGRVKGIAKTRRYIMNQYVGDKVLMLDDDMVFATRPSMHEPDLEKCGAKEFNAMMRMIEKLLIQYPAVGISARQGNNHVSEAYTIASRMMNAYAFDVDKMNEIGVQFGRIPVMEDFDLTLQMLRKGYPNAVIYKYCWNQRGSGAHGGCSGYRTGKMQADAAHELKRLHPDFVKVVEKESKSGWKDMKVRTDVNVQWKKAYASGVNK